jgi:hypothetical protein
MSMFSGGELTRAAGLRGCVTIPLFSLFTIAVWEGAKWVFEHIQIGVTP